MKKLILCIFAISAFVLSASTANAAYVRGHYRSDGTYVQPHYRSNPMVIQTIITAIKEM